LKQKYHALNTASNGINRCKFEHNRWVFFIYEEEDF